MSAATATITVNTYPAGIDNTQRNEIVRGTIAISQGTYPAGGFSLDWSGQERIKAIAPTSKGPAPIDVDVKSVASPPSGVPYAWDSVTGNLHIFQVGPTGSTVSGPLVEFYTGNNIPGYIYGDKIAFTAEFTRNN